jgi:hypothetical protein
MRVTPKISESPDAMRKRNIALARPLRSWTRRRDMALPHPALSPEAGERVIEIHPLPSRERAG